jgi:hypothetical protein
MSLALEAVETPPAGLFWSAPLASDSDFTAEDPLALDYLGQQVGLWLFRGFTTRTNRAQNYAVVLYGLHLAEVAIRKYGYSGDDETRTRLFERWERFWALATLEFRDGELTRGDDDAMRGVLGAKRAWFRGPAPMPLDFPLISRQNELGGLGAYLSSLREYGLVFPGTLRVTPAARGILDAFWVEQGEKGTHHLYEEYALEALDFDHREIARKRGLLTLAGLGRRSRLSCLVRRSRTDQQQRLWRVLFANARDDSTLPLSKQLIAAHAAGIDEAEALLEGFLAGRWGELRSEVSSKVEVALAFGRMARVLLDRFHRAYGHVNERGWVADFGDVAVAAFPQEDMRELRAACSTVLEASGAARFRKLPEHGPGFVTLLGKLAGADSVDCLDHLLTFHQRVQRSRRGGGSWLRREQDKLVMQVAGYSGYKSEAAFPGLKLAVVRRLLTDLGKLK